MLNSLNIYKVNYLIPYGQRYDINRNEIIKTNKIIGTNLWYIKNKLITIYYYNIQSVDEL